MQPDSKKYLFDIRRAARLIESFCAGRSFEDYVADRIVWGVVETSLPGLMQSVEGLLPGT